MKIRNVLIQFILVFIFFIFILVKGLVILLCFYHFYYVLNMFI